MGCLEHMDISSPFSNPCETGQLAWVVRNGFGTFCRCVFVPLFHICSFEKGLSRFERRDFSVLSLFLVFVYLVRVFSMIG